MHNGYKNYPCVSFFAEMCLYVDFFFCVCVYERERESEKKKRSDTEVHTEG